MAILRLASFGVVRRALRAISSPKILPGFIANAFSGNTNQDTLVKRESNLSIDFKKLADCKLVNVLKSEIKSEQLFLEKTLPADFPFRIEDDPRTKSYITLIREFDTEKIDVLVHMPSSTDSDSDEDDSSATDSDSDEAKEKPGAYQAPSIRLCVEISKKHGKNLRFRVSAFADEIIIRSISVNEPADRWSRPRKYRVDPYSDLQFALTDFLKIRGIKKSTARFLYKYMVRKSREQPMPVLKDMEEFIKK